LVDRSERDVARGDSDDVLRCLQVSGACHFGQDGRQATNESGSFVLIDTRRPFSIVLPDRTRSISFKLPREALEVRLGSIAGLTARTISPKGSLGGLASGFLSLLPERVAAIEGAAAARLAHNALDLVALATAQALGGTNGSKSTISRTLFRLKSVIEARLRDPDLKPAAVAAAAGISVRYANALLAREGSSVERYILHRRLERCRDALADPMLGGRMISEIAYALGLLGHVALRKALSCHLRNVGRRLSQVHPKSGPAAAARVERCEGAR
jgi:AraC-like DNA-binding protein